MVRITRIYKPSMNGHLEGVPTTRSSGDDNNDQPWANQPLTPPGMILQKPVLHHPFFSWSYTVIYGVNTSVWDKYLEVNMVVPFG